MLIPHHIHASILITECELFKENVDVISNIYLFSSYLFMSILCIGKLGNWFPWNDQEMGRGLGIDVLESHTLHIYSKKKTG